MTIGMVVFWGLVIRAFVAAGYLSDRAERRSPEQLLDERFAAGEIDSDDYDQRLEALHSAQRARWGPRS